MVKTVSFSTRHPVNLKFSQQQQVELLSKEQCIRQHGENKLSRLKMDWTIGQKLAYLATIVVGVGLVGSIDLGLIELGVLNFIGIHNSCESVSVLGNLLRDLINGPKPPIENIVRGIFVLGVPTVEALITELDTNNTLGEHNRLSQSVEAVRRLVSAVEPLGIKSEDLEIVIPKKGLPYIVVSVDNPGRIEKNIACNSDLSKRGSRFGYFKKAEKPLKIGKQTQDYYQFILHKRFAWLEGEDYLRVILKNSHHPYRQGLLPAT